MTFTIFNYPLFTFPKNESLEPWHNWLLSNWSRLLNWKGPGTLPQSSILFKRFVKIIALVYIYQLAKFGDLMSCGSKDIYSKMHPVSCSNAYHDVTNLVNHKWLKIKKNLNILRTKQNLFEKSKFFWPVLYITHFEKLSFCSLR